MARRFISSTHLLLMVRQNHKSFEMERLTVNENVSSIITASEPIRMVDISTDSIVGDKPLDNVIRLKPISSHHQDGEVMGIVTIITERYRVQYALV